MLKQIQQTIYCLQLRVIESFHPGASLMTKINAVLKQNQQTIHCLQLQVIESFHPGANLMAKLNVALKQSKGYDT